MSKLTNNDQGSNDPFNDLKNSQADMFRKLREYLNAKFLEIGLLACIIYMTITFFLPVAVLSVGIGVLIMASLMSASIVSFIIDKVTTGIENFFRSTKANASKLSPEFNAQENQKPFIIGRGLSDCNKKVSPNKGNSFFNEVKGDNNLPEQDNLGATNNARLSNS